MQERRFRWDLAYRSSRDGRYRPLLPVTFTYAKSTGWLNGLVDSGAEHSVCSVRVAREVGIDLNEFPVRRVRGIGGITRARLCPTDMEILGRRIASEFYVVDADLILLGRNDVFNAFQLGFDERAKLRLIEPYDES